MTIAEIINEIDACLLCLRHARDLLLAPMTGARREREPRRKRVVKASKTGRPLSSNVIRENKSRFDPMVAPTTTPKQRVDPVSRVRGSVNRLGPQATACRGHGSETAAGCHYRTAPIISSADVLNQNCASACHETRVQHSIGKFQTGHRSRQSCPFEDCGGLSRGSAT